MKTFEEFWENDSGWGGEQLAEYHLAKAAWNAATEAAKPRWIPVSERLPSFSRSVLVKGNRIGPSEAVLIDDGKFHIYCFNKQIAGITHWMEIPE